MSCPDDAACRRPASSGAEQGNPSWPGALTRLSVHLKNPVHDLRGGQSGRRLFLLGSLKKKKKTKHRDVYACTRLSHCPRTVTKLFPAWRWQAPGARRRHAHVLATGTVPLRRETALRCRRAWLCTLVLPPPRGLCEFLASQPVS